MFKTQLSGKFNVLIPIKRHTNCSGAVYREDYEVEMRKVKKQILPYPMFNKTTIYAYGG